MIYEFDGRTPSVGEGTYVSETATVIGDVVISDLCYTGYGSILRGDYGRIEIGSGTAVEEGVIIHVPPGKVGTIGEKVTLGHGAIIHSESIGDLVVIGMGAIASIGAKVGAGAIVAEGVVAAGNPAKILRETAQKDKDFWDWGK